MANFSSHLLDKIVPPQQVYPDLNSLLKPQAGKTILITGAGGCIGSALAKTLVNAEPNRILLLDHSEQSLYELQTELSATSNDRRYEIILGDFAGESLLSALLDSYKPDLILHAAAFKHVPLMEANPFEAIRNNSVATWKLGKMAAERGVRELILISTDKAARPRSVMGASKRIAELAALRWSAPGRRYLALRLGNVLGSQGSVVPLFKEQVARGGPVTVTDPDASRYFLTLQRTVHLVFATSALRVTSGIFLPELGEPVRILDLANHLISAGQNGLAKKIEIHFTGLRPGDKLHEDLLSADETLAPTESPALRRIAGAIPSDREIDQSIEKLSESVQLRDLPKLICELRDIVPDYEPSKSLTPARPSRAISGAPA